MTSTVECNNCSCTLQLHRTDISQILRCPQCGGSVVTYADSYPDTVLPHTQKPIAPTWPWTDIITGCLIPVAIIGIVFVLAFLLKDSLRPQTMYWIVILVCLALPISMLIYTLCIFKKRKVAPQIKFGSPMAVLEAILISFGVYLIIMFITIAVTLSFKYLFRIDNSPDTYTKFNVLSSSTPVYLIFLVSLFTLIPVCEELFFRGFLYTALKNRVHWIWAILVQAAFFSVLHLAGVAHSIVIFLMGLIFCFIYEKKKNLLIPILIHSMNNFVASMLLLGLFILNYHAPAQTWQEAETNPHWLSARPPAYVAEMETAEDQRLHAIEKWGSIETRQWKKEMNAFNAVLEWFPEEHETCAQTKYGIVTIYLYHLRDYRRAVVHADQLLAEYPDIRETCAQAHASRAHAYYLLGDYEKCRTSLEAIQSQYSDFENEIESANKLLKRIKD